MRRKCILLLTKFELEDRHNILSMLCDNCAAVACSRTCNAVIGRELNINYVTSNLNSDKKHHWRNGPIYRTATLFVYIVIYKVMEIIYVDIIIR